jgi:hypothetical protein
MHQIKKIDDIKSYASYFLYLDTLSLDVYILNSNHNFDKRFYEWVNISKCNSTNDKSRSCLDSFKKIFSHPYIIIECPTLIEFKDTLGKLLKGELDASTLCS